MPLPETKEGLEAAGYVFDNESTCRGCGLPIEWWITPKGKKMPMSVQEIKKEPKFLAPVMGWKRVPHWSDCPNAADFRRK